MNATLRAFLAGLIDYAGLFPPAALPLDAAFRRYARLHAGRDAWMLGRFIAPASSLDDLAPLLEGTRFGAANPLRLSVLAGFGGDAALVRAELEADSRSIQRLLERRHKKASIEAIETRLPADVAGAAHGDRISSFLALLREFARGVAPGSLDLWVEAPPSLAWRETAGALIERISMDRGRNSNRAGRIGFKLRCGGADPAAVPAVDTVASTIAACRDAEVPLKCTAGLHHPVRRGGEPPEDAGHGFLSVFGAAIFAHAIGWPQDRIAECVAEENADAFEFREKKLAWDGDTVTLDQVVRSRSMFASGFGSCSFDEPREDLAALGWLEPVEDGED